MISTLLPIFIIVMVAYSMLAIMLYYMQPRFLYCPLKQVSYTPEELGLEYEDVTFKAADKTKLNGWFVPADNAEFTILFCHGNGGNIMHRLDSISLFHNLGVNVFIFDYRGYGNSEGTPSEEGTYMDVRAARRYLARRKKIPHDNIIIFGRSLGGSIAAYLATRIKARALVIESSFTSYADIGKKFYPYMPVHWFAKFNYPTIDYIKKVHCPVMIIHSRTDEVIPFEFGLELYEATNEPKEFIEIQGGHNDGFLISGELYKKAWSQWINKLSKSSKNLATKRKSS